MTSSPTLRDWAGLLALTALWGSAFMLNELVLRDLPPSMLVAGRVTISAIVLLIVMAASGTRLPAVGAGWIPMLVMAVFGTALPFQLIAWAQQHIDSAQAGVLMAVMPLFILTLAHFFVPGSRLTGYRIAGFVLGFAGVVLVIGPPAPGGTADGAMFLGSLAVLGAALSYAVNSIYARRVPASQPLTLAAGTMLAASLLVFPSAALEVPQLAGPPGLVAIASLAVLGILATGLATVIYLRIVQGPGPAFLSLVNYLVPAWAVVAGALVLGESPSATGYAGLGLILSGVAFSELGPRIINRLEPVLARRLPAAEDAG